MIILFNMTVKRLQFGKTFNKTKYKYSFSPDIKIKEPNRKGPKF